MMKFLGQSINYGQSAHGSYGSQKPGWTYENLFPNAIWIEIPGIFKSIKLLQATVIMEAMEDSVVSVVSIKIDTSSF